MGEKLVLHGRTIQDKEMLKMIAKSLEAKYGRGFV